MYEFPRILFYDDLMARHKAIRSWVPTGCTLARAWSGETAEGFLWDEPEWTVISVGGLMERQRDPGEDDLETFLNEIARELKPNMRPHLVIAHAIQLKLQDKVYNALNHIVPVQISAFGTPRYRAILENLGSKIRRDLNYI